jgi:urease accessory protein
VAVQPELRSGELIRIKIPPAFPRIPEATNMLEFTENLGPLPEERARERLSLDHEGRRKSRQRVRLDSGKEAGLFLERGKTLAGGDILRATDGTLALVLCKKEEIVTASTTDWLTLAKGCYHMGNRHVPLQIGPLWIRFTPDAGLENMLRRLGFDTHAEFLPFAPESGAGALPEAWNTSGMTVGLAEQKGRDRNK